MNKTETRHIELREKLIMSAESIIAEEGLSALKSRDVTAAAGCSLGALYNVVSDLDHLIMYVNVRTLQRMGATLEKASLQAQPSPDARLQSLAKAYIDFAIENKNLWLALFQFHLPEGAEIPDWYREEHFVLISYIIEPLSVLMPDVSVNELMLRARTTFAAVHGVVIFAMEGGYVSIPQENLYSEVRALVSLMTHGVKALNENRG